MGYSRWCLDTLGVTINCAHIGRAELSRPRVISLSYSAGEPPPHPQRNPNQDERDAGGDNYFFRFGHLPTSITCAWTYETIWPSLGMLPAGFEPASEARKAPILDRTRLRERNGRLAA